MFGLEIQNKARIIWVFLTKKFNRKRVRTHKISLLVKITYIGYRLKKNSFNHHNCKSNLRRLSYGHVGTSDMVEIKSNILTAIYLVSIYLVVKLDYVVSYESIKESFIRFD